MITVPRVLRFYGLVFCVCAVAFLLMRTVSAAPPPSLSVNGHHAKLDSFDAMRSATRAQLAAPAASAVLINELDSDTPGIDTAEFIELAGPPNTALDGLCLVAFNGTNDTSYLAVDLDGKSLNANGYFVVGNAGVANVGLTFANSVLQNGPDAVALYEAAACTTIFPNNTAVTTANLVDAIVYNTGTTIDTGLAPLLNAGQTQVNEAANADSANQANARCPDGSGGARNTSAYSQVAPSPGVANPCTQTTPTPTATVPPGSTATPIPTPTNTPAATPGVADLQITKQSSTNAVTAGQLFTYTIIINNAGPGPAQGVTVKDLIPTGLSFNGSPSIHALKGTGAKVSANSSVLTGTVTTLNAGGVVTITARAVVALNATGPTLLNTVSMTATNDSNLANNTASATVNLGAAATSPVLINELDTDTPGADTAEFVELYGPPNTSLDGLCLVAYNGASDSSYLSIDLDSHTLNANGYFVVGNAAIASAGLTFANSALQNGPDAIALYVAPACTAVFPSDTALTTNNLVDALIYDTGKTVDAGLAPLLNAGQAQVDEAANNDSANQANARCPDGAGGARNTTAYRQVTPSPGSANCTNGTATPTPPATAQPTATATLQATAAAPTPTPPVGELQDKLYLPVVVH